MPTDERDPQLLKGVLPILVIGLLGARESYGYELLTRMHAIGLQGLTSGTLYPVLSRLEREGRLTSRLEASSSGPARKYYQPTSDGEAHYTTALAAWRDLREVVDAVATEHSAAAAHNPAKDARS